MKKNTLKDKCSIKINVNYTKNQIFFIFIVILRKIDEKIT
jgi:hypothetical protein